MRCFDESLLVLPPAHIIKKLKLTPCYGDLSWKDSNGADVIRCNNAKSSYYKDSIGSTVFIREDVYNKLLHDGEIKFFAFTERYIPATGYADETAVHFELKNDQIVKRFYNDDQGRQRELVENDCEKCKWGFNQKEYNESEMLQMLRDYIGIDSDLEEL